MDAPAQPQSTDSVTRCEPDRPHCSASKPVQMPEPSERWRLARGAGPSLFRITPTSQILFISSLLTLAASHQSSQLPPVSTKPALFVAARLSYPALESTLQRPLPTKLHRVDQRTDERLALIQGRLAELRRQLEAELLVSNRRQVTLGSPCLKADDCTRYIGGSHCKLDNFTCACLPQHVEHNSTTCLASALLGYECLVDAQCQQRVANSLCSAGRCACPANLVTHRKDKCLPAMKINDYCLNDRQCQLADRHSHCKWKIPQVYGLCKCPPNFKLVTPALNDSLRTSSARCAPRLGDSCLEHEECLLATPHSRCREPTGSDQRAGWRSSDAGPRKCFCGPGFAATPDRLGCAPTRGDDSEAGGADADTGPAGQLTLSATGSMDSKHHYELVITNETAPAGDGGEQPKTPGGPAAAAGDGPAPRPSSLGKACSSRLECQLRDPHSDCINGICECLRPTSRCSANSTGCHRDTFQCRNGQCISWYFVCDQFKNCDDGSDEDQCQPDSCPPEAFQCDNGACLARGKLCNGRRECADGSDERQCHSSAELVAARANSSTGLESVSPFSLPAPSLSPSPSSSSSVLSPPRATCHPRAFTCDNGQCLPAYTFCNAVEDCDDRSDEKEQLCERVSARRKWAPPPPPKQAQHEHTDAGSKLSRPTLDSQLEDSPLVKADRLSINKMLAGLQLTARTPENRGRQQLDQRPQQSRRARLTAAARQSRLVTTAKECPATAFTCRNGKCRSSAIVCSGVDGCGDNSDEEHCQVCQCEPTHSNG